MFAKFQRLKDRLTIWAILRLNVKLPDLQQTPKPRPGTIYYYYGRWVKLTRHHKDSVAPKVFEWTDDQKTDWICQKCALHQLGLPCHKYKGGTPEDLCLTHSYELVKGKSYDQEIQS